MSDLAIEKPQRTDWSDLYSNVARVKNSAEYLLFLTEFVKGIPTVVRMLSGKLSSIPAFASIALLKPYEIFLGAIKDTGSLMELFEKVPPLLLGRVKRETGSRYWGRRADAVAVAIEGLLLIPLRWNLIDFGKWSASIGRFKFIKDGFALVAIGCSIHTAKSKLKKNSEKVERCKGDLCVLKKLDQLLQKPLWNAEQLQEIDRLKKKCDDKPIDSLILKIGNIERQKKALQMRWQHANGNDNVRLMQKLKALDQEWLAKRANVARMQMWKQNVQTTKIDELREIVQLNIAKREIGRTIAEKKIEKATVGRWFDISIFSLIVLSNMVELGVALVLAPHLGLSVVTVGSILFLGQWITSLSTGLLGFGKTAAMLRYKSVVRNSAL